MKTKKQLLQNSFFASLSKRMQNKVLKAINQDGRIFLTSDTNGAAQIRNLHYTIKHYGKMTDVISISTSVLDNPICAARRLDTSTICSHCFAAAQMSCYKNMQPVFSKNLQILSSRLLEPEEIPVILPKSGLLRVESFGDVCNVIQAANYLRIAAANPWCRAAIWTKNPQYYLAAIKGEYAEKAGNTNLILSSVRVNEQDEIKSKYSELFDRVFTVYDMPGIKAKSININCGARSCASCKKCYKKDSTLFAINEKLK